MADPTIDWRKRILLSCWAIRICLMLIIIIGFGVAIGSNYDDSRRVVNYPAAVVFLFLTVLVLLLDAAQIFLWTLNRLQPAYFVGLTSFQAVFWGLVLLMDIISIAKHQQSPRAVGLVVVVFLLYFGVFVYALFGKLKQRKLAIHGH